MAEGGDRAVEVLLTGGCFMVVMFFCVCVREREDD